MDKKVFGPLVLVLLIFGSLASMAIVELTKQEPEEPGNGPGPTPPETPVDTTQIAFYAEDVDANITEFMELHPIHGYTDETNLAELVQALQGLESVSRIIGPRYLEPEPGKERFMPLDAEIVPAKDSNAWEFLEEAEAKGVLSEITAFRKAVVKIPVSVPLKSLSPDLNLSRDQNFEEPFVVSIVTLDSLVGDNLKIRLYLKMAGTQLLRETIEGEIMENLSSAPQFHQASLETEISRLEESLGFEARIAWNGFEGAALAGRLEELPGVDAAEAELFGTGNAFTISLSRQGIEDINSLERDLNAEISAVDGVSIVFPSHDENTLELRITFDTSKDYATIRTLVGQAVESLLPDAVLEFTHPSANLQGSVSFPADQNTQMLALKSGSIFAEYGIESIPWRNAYFEAESLVDGATEEEFPLSEENREFPVRALAGAGLGDKMALQIVFYTIRGEVVSGGVQVQSAIPVAE